MKQTCRHFIVASVVVLFILLIVSAVNAEVTVTNATFRLVSATNGPATNDSETVPLIHFQEVPITAAIMNLARQSEINYLIDPQLFPATDDEGKPLVEPLVTFRL